MSDPPRPQSPDVVDQIQMVLRYLERSLLALEPVRPGYRYKYNQLRRLRDQLEEAFVREQTERLRLAAVDFTHEVDQLRQVVSDLEQAARRAGQTREVLGYVSLAVEATTRVLATIVPLL
ncbi:MAG: hypothetical protein RMK29_08925 [Myxococcales bacterium]|nr:hypothetical protein [Myxococcota bacterium]MDW8281820.1 hypothetical protein [Myxococcales bacterium]